MAPVRCEIRRNGVLGPQEPWPLGIGQHQRPEPVSRPWVDWMMVVGGGGRKR